MIKPSSKVWIYTAQSMLDAAHLEQISIFSQTFLDSWESHGAPVIGGIEVLYNRFIVIYADDCDGHLCGRAQDAQVRFIKELESSIGISLMNRMLIPFKGENEVVNVLPMSEFSVYAKTLENPSDLIVYDNTVTNFSDFQSKWETKLVDTWMTRVV